LHQEDTPTDDMARDKVVYSSSSQKTKRPAAANFATSLLVFRVKNQTLAPAQRLFCRRVEDLTSQWIQDQPVGSRRIVEIEEAIQGAGGRVG
jgi:hypothetical protein